MSTGLSEILDQRMNKSLSSQKTQSPRDTRRKTVMREMAKAAEVARVSLKPVFSRFRSSLLNFRSRLQAASQTVGQQSSTKDKQTPLSAVNRAKPHGFYQFIDAKQSVCS